MCMARLMSKSQSHSNADPLRQQTSTVGAVTSSKKLAPVHSMVWPCRPLHAKKPQPHCNEINSSAHLHIPTLIVREENTDIDKGSFLAFGSIFRCFRYIGKRFTPPAFWLCPVHFCCFLATSRHKLFEIIRGHRCCPKHNLRLSVS